LAVNPEQFTPSLCKYITLASMFCFYISQGTNNWCKYNNHMTSQDHIISDITTKCKHELLSVSNKSIKQHWDYLHQDSMALSKVHQTTIAHMNIVKLVLQFGWFGLSI
jgi:IS1 family transposase